MDNGRMEKNGKCVKSDQQMTKCISRFKVSVAKESPYIDVHLICLFFKLKRPYKFTYISHTVNVPLECSGGVWNGIFGSRTSQTIWQKLKPSNRHKAVHLRVQSIGCSLLLWNDTLQKSREGFSYLSSVNGQCFSSGKKCHYAYKYVHKRASQTHTHSPINGRCKIATLI